MTKLAINHAAITATLVDEDGVGFVLIGFVLKDTGRCPVGCLHSRQSTPTFGGEAASVLATPAAEDGFVRARTRNVKGHRERHVIRSQHFAHAGGADRFDCKLNRARVGEHPGKADFDIVIVDTPDGGTVAADRYWGGGAWRCEPSLA